MWIRIEDELPIQNWGVRVKNGKSLADAYYWRKKWRSYGRLLHKVTEWWKCPVVYPKIPAKDMKAYLKRAEKYKHQMKPKKMTFGPAIGLHSFPPRPDVPISEEEFRASLVVFKD